MIDLTGRFGTAKVFTNNIDTETEKQILNIMNSELTKNSKVRIMPDTHAGAGGPIGLTMTIEDKLAPDLVGSDIGCGVALYEVDWCTDLDLSILDSIIQLKLPSGFETNSMKHIEVSKKNIKWIKKLVSNLKCVNKTGKGGKIPYADIIDRAINTFATLGGGNHFLEAYKHDTNINKMYLSLHTGSRTLGQLVYKHYKGISKNYSLEKYLKERNDIVEKLKSEGKYQLIETELNKVKEEYEKVRSLDESFKYLKGKDMEDYIHDVGLLTDFARKSRETIISNIVEYFNTLIHIIKKLPKENNLATFKSIVDKAHNYIDTEKRILRKGAQSSEGHVLIPINMRDGMILGFSKDGDTEEDWNYSAPHGAGRRLSRTEARKELDVDDFVEQMKNIFSTTVGEDTIDEAPDAYKSLEEIQENILESIEVIKILKPIYNFKGGSEIPVWKRDS